MKFGIKDVSIIGVSLLLGVIVVMFMKIKHEILEIFLEMLFGLIFVILGYALFGMSKKNK